MVSTILDVADIEVNEIPLTKFPFYWREEQTNVIHWLYVKVSDTR